MKRDWDLLRQQLTDIEEERNVFSNIPEEPKWTDQTEEEFSQQYEEYRAIESRIAGHVELLINSGYVEGIQVLRGADGHFSFSIHSPRLTMAGHDLLNTMSSDTVWAGIKRTAQSKGLELTFEVVKQVGKYVVERIMTGQSVSGIG
jgi:hypothetical protein